MELGADPGAPGETWLTVEAAPTLGLRGFRKPWTLLAFLAEHWRRSLDEQPEFTVDQILAWADAWDERTGKRPIQTSGNIPGPTESTGRTWTTRCGPVGLTFPRVSRCAASYRDARSLSSPGPASATEDQILEWADCALPADRHVADTRCGLDCGSVGRGLESG